MSETKQPEVTKFPSATELVTQLKAKAQSWIDTHAGKTNYNPHLSVAKLITPLVTQLSLKDALVNKDLIDKINAIPAECPVLNPNWKPEPVNQGIPFPATAKPIQMQKPSA